MRNILNMPTYDELVEMPNGELMKCLASAKDQLSEANKATTFAKTQIYRAYNAERLKRLQVVSKSMNHYVD